MQKYIPEVKIKHSEGDPKFIIVYCDGSERGRILKKNTGKFEVYSDGTSVSVDTFHDALYQIVPNLIM